MEVAPGDLTLLGIAVAVIYPLLLSCVFPILVGYLYPRLIQAPILRPVWFHKAKFVFAVVQILAGAAVGTAATVLDHYPKTEFNKKPKQLAISDLGFSSMLFSAGFLELCVQGTRLNIISCCLSLAVVIFKMVALESLVAKGNFHVFLSGLFWSQLASITSVATLLFASAEALGASPIIPLLTLPPQAAALQAEYLSEMRSQAAALQDEST